MSIKPRRQVANGTSPIKFVEADSAELIGDGGQSVLDHSLFLFWDATGLEDIHIDVRKCRVSHKYKYKCTANLFSLLFRAVGERVENGRESSKQKLEQKHGNQRSLWIYGRRSKSVATPIATPEFLTEMQSTTGVSVPVSAILGGIVKGDYRRGVTAPLAAV
ncbi:hypothetical protein MCOR07_003925 [Pyricularia oryzae]|nr:hypothetical protein MCOR01_002207 [Pyricularia oryzae]KAI6361148.1 hypothetical protein MCOR32_008797 [Pyricularia oryzae]KAI6558525.1 hypothetical protein MCOR03_005285 [Pyricularia oryzae]KAI6571710.1 hypothetical protein MCOR09_003937 [Pyricularia oryzae]KAI6623354.1 hypothetical protein MCOR07_003925 [Pyricularia oryzae]